MTMPIDLILVRHGQSEGNAANWRSRHDDHSAFTEEFRERHSSKWRLTDKGIEQARAAGQWLKENDTLPFDRHYTSEYIRAMETAYHLGLPQASWYLEFYLRERDYGKLDVLPDDQRRQRFAEDLERRKIDGFFWVPPGGGESLAQLCLRTDRVLNTLHRECGDKRVIAVCHGDTIWSFRVRLERMTQSRFHELDKSADPLDRLHNCQIIHYTRRDPVSGKLSPYLNWLRSVCPWDLSLSSNGWQEIRRQRMSNEMLLQMVREYPRLVNHD